MKKESYQNNAIVKALKQAGFDDEYIEKAIADGKITLDEEGNDKETDPSKEKEKDKMKKNVDKEKEGCEKELEKSINSDLLKSFGDNLLKSFSDSLLESVKGMIVPELEELKKSIAIISQQPQPFKSEGLNGLSFLEKSIKKDENGKLVVNIISQRSLAKSLIEKELNSMDEDVRKSMSNEALAYLANPEAEIVGESLARYMFDKGVKFVR